MKFGEKIKLIFLPFRWTYFILIAFWIYGSFFSSFSKTNGFITAAVIYGILFILPIVIREIVISRKTKNKNHQNSKNMSCKKERKAYSDRYIGPRRIAGLSIVGVAILCLLIGILANSSPETYLPNNMYPGYTFGAIGLILLLLSIGDPKTKTEAAERKAVKLAQKEARIKQAEYKKRMKAYKGVYLSEQQIHRLESRTELPVIDTPVFLNSGEVAVYYCAATLQEVKNRVVGRTGSYVGGTIRIAKGFSVHTGGSSSRPVYGNITTHYEGEMVLTTNRLVFLSVQKGFEIPYHNITAGTAYSDGLSIQSRSHTYTLILPKAELATIAFDAVRTGKIPIAGSATSEYDAHDDYDDFNLNSVSSIDGMGGHDFEYFCADLLRKNGFFEVSVTKGSGDQGVDVLATKDGIKYAIQCKNYVSALGNTPVQEVHAGKTFYSCHVGVVMTNSTFTPGAKTLAQATGVLLWDRATLQKMMEDAE